MLLKEYLSYAKVFPYIEEYVSQLKDKGEVLDRIMKREHGLKSCGSAITGSLTDGIVSEDDQKEIAEYVYYCNKHRWDSLFKFIESDINSLYDYSESKETTYGKVVDDETGGKDSYGQTDKIAGFDSTDFVDSENTQHDTTYGKTDKTTSSGKDVVTLNRRDSQVESLVDYTMKFWETYDVVRTLITDCLKVITLPMYEIDD